MWPFESGIDARRTVLRVGRERVELWAASPQGLALDAQCLLHCTEVPTPEALSMALQELFTERSTPCVDAVIESAWLPVVQLEVGHTMWRRNQVEALLRHRLTQIYGNQAGASQLLLDHRAGDAVGLGYALNPTVKKSLFDAVAKAGVRLGSLQPAFAWGRDRLRRRRHMIRGGWFVWMEQDRALVACIQQGRVSALNTGATLPRDASEASRLVNIESARQGIVQSEMRAVVVGWNAALDIAASNEAHGLSWLSATALTFEQFASAAVNSGSAT